MTNRNEGALPRYEGRRDSVTGEILPPIGWERETGIPASEFDSEAWLKENGYRPEKSLRKQRERKAREKTNARLQKALNRDKKKD